MLASRRSISRPLAENNRPFRTASPSLDCFDGLRQAFQSLIPDRPYCADKLSDGLKIRERRLALEHRHIQLNGPASFRWMSHDLDRDDAYFAHHDANLPEPNFIAINPENGHGHCAVLLVSPVARHSAARIEPLRFYGAVERGIARRLAADRYYSGLITKNPLHPHWRVEWRRDEPFTLPELADWLFREDMQPDPTIETTLGAGRNVTVFDKLRQIAYREVLTFKRAGPIEAWLARCLHVAIALNQQFPRAMRLSEVRSIAKSVAKWTWRHFSERSFSERQSQRGKRGNAKRWAGHIAERQIKPWEGRGISRRTYYSRKKAGTLAGCTIAISDNSPSWGLRPVPHLVRRDGFGLVFNGAPIDRRWAAPMRGIAAAVAAGKVPFGVFPCSPSARAAA